MHNSLPIAALGFKQSESRLEARNDNTKAVNKDNLEDENEANKATFKIKQGFINIYSNNKTRL